MWTRLRLKIAIMAPRSASTQDSTMPHPTTRWLCRHLGHTWHPGTLPHSAAQCGSEASTLSTPFSHPHSSRWLQPSGTPPPHTHTGFTVGAFPSISGPTCGCRGSTPHHRAPHVWTRHWHQGLNLQPVVHPPPSIGLPCCLTKFVLSLPHHLLVTMFT